MAGPLRICATPVIIVPVILARKEEKGKEAAPNHGERNKGGMMNNIGQVLPVCNGVLVGSECELNRAW